MKSQRDLIERFEYQFKGNCIGFELTRGWRFIFEQLCTDIDAVLGDDKRGFHWRQVKEKFGSLRASFRLDDGVYEREPDLVRKLFDLKNKAEKASETACASCGHPGHIDLHSRYLMALCNTHRNEVLVGIPVSFWLDDDEVST